MNDVIKEVGILDAYKTQSFSEEKDLNGFSTYSKGNSGSKALLGLDFYCTETQSIIKFTNKLIFYVILVEEKPSSLLILLFLSALIHRQWLNVNTIITSGDWVYFNEKVLLSINAFQFNTWLEDLNMGRPVFD